MATKKRKSPAKKSPRRRPTPEPRDAIRIVPVAAPFIMLVLSVTLKMLVASLPLIVNLLFF